MYIETAEAGEVILKVARRQFNRRRMAYESVSLMDVEDLSQEMWFQMLEKGCDVAPDVLGATALGVADSISQTGRKRRQGIDGIRPILEGEREHVLPKHV